MPVSIWTYPGEGNRAELLKEHLEDLEKKGEIGSVVPLHDSILIHWHRTGPKRESRAAT
jgi:hypothetical protein